MDTTAPHPAFRSRGPLVVRGLGRTVSSSVASRNVDAFLLDDDLGLFGVVHDPRGERAQAMAARLRFFFDGGREWARHTSDLDLATAAVAAATGQDPDPGVPTELGLGFVLLRHRRALLVETGPCRNYLLRAGRLRPVEPNADDRFVRALSLDACPGDRFVLASPGAVPALTPCPEPSLLEGPRGPAANWLLGLPARPRKGAATVVLVEVKRGP